MSSEQYSPLDTTIPFFSNEIAKSFRNQDGPFIIPFLLKFKAIARRVKITVYQQQGNEDNVDVYFDGDLENPSRINGGGAETFNRWTKHLRIVSNSPTSNHPILVQFDLVPVEYLPPKTRVG